MRSSKQISTTKWRSAHDFASIGKFFLTCTLTIVAVVFGVANSIAQTTTPTASNTLLATGFTLPYGAQVLSGTAINPATGRPFRHLWTGDTGGLCRLDPDLDTGAPLTVNPATCITTVAGVAFTPGRMVYDPLNNTIYSVDDGGPANVARFHFLPDGDNGHGLVSPTAEFLGDTGGCGLSGSFPWAVAMGPDANLYVSFKTSGNLVRIIAPESQIVPCSNVQVMGSTPDARRGLAVTFVGHDIWGADIRGLFNIPNADQCFSPANNFAPCKGTTRIKTLIPGVFTLVSDQVYPAVNGDSVYIAETQNAIVKLSGLTSPTGNITIDNNWAGNFLFLIGIAFDNSPTGPVIYVGDDPGQEAGVAGGGRYYAVSTTPPPPSVPGTPIAVTASSGDTQAFLTWLSGGGSLATSYTVRNSLASNGHPVANVIVTVVGSTLTPAVAISGLVNGVTYQFEVSATNAQGSSPFSAPSNSVVPLAITVPGAPTGASAQAADSQATVSWVPPASNGNATITSYTATARIAGVPTAHTATTANGTATSLVVAGLTNGTTYTFTVHATNIKGAGPESAPSNAVTPTRPLGATDMAISMTGPASITSGGNASYVLTANNLGPSFAPQVTVNDFVPAGATFVSGTPSQGACTLLGSQFQCNLGGIVVGGSATVTVVLNVTAAITNTATVSANDAAGNPLTDLSPVNNTTSFSTVITAPPTTTDLQVTGSPLNGGPTSGPATTDTITWQIKNTQNAPANTVVFTATLPAGLPFSSVSNSTGTCTAPAVGSGGTITCNASTVAAGQTMIVTVNFSVPAVGSFSSTGHASFNGTDTNTPNNTFTVTINAK
ncbi:MAG: fibronectin type III domain-containing protein [Candidatus Angelobacter sp.]